MVHTVLLRDQCQRSCVYWFEWEGISAEPGGISDFEVFNELIVSLAAVWKEIKNWHALGE